ncbi:hypothetical protein H3146_10285 [Streptomyces sp. OF3]|uniref:WXG100 family type VII secretion target n=1 Tax=Streptomyces alkaliterrae TaxID=2213162 RepID=A0A7W3ZMI5_9ACTN|nr:hypothetical protein [Streptomyces alkaliterrae]MBB1253753.1 hypothetical protein [Streptomyces alkaliterrae]
MADAECRKQFTGIRLNQVKAMIEGADPAHVKSVGENWVKLRKELVGDDWEGGIKKKFDDAVRKVLQSWHGDSAEKFAKRAQQISKDMGNLATHPQYVGTLLEQVSERLQAVKASVAAVKEPSSWERAKDRGGDLLSSDGGRLGMLAGAPGVLTAGALGAGRNDSQLNADLANPMMSIYDAVNRNRGSLSIDRERELEAAHHVEQLAMVYKSAKDQLDADHPTREGPQIPPRVPGGPGGSGPSLPPVAPFGPPPASPTPGPGMDMPNGGGPGYTTPTPATSPRPDGLNGIGGPDTNQVGTGLNGVSGGTGGVGAVGTGANGLGSGAGVGGVGGGLGAGAGGVGGVSGAGGGGVPGGVPGMPGGTAGGARGGSAGARGSGRMGGMPGMGGAGAGGAGGAKGAGGKGSLAKRRGGIAGAAGRAGAGAQGGSGLHRSRGGTQAGKGGGRGAGMMGAPGARGAGANDDKNRKDRPDYLVEDEETWTPKRNVAPRVIE